MEYIFLLILAYLLGSIPSGKIIARMYGVDIQKRGSGNIGFSNVRRILGWRAGIPTLLIDIAKGWLPTYLATLSYGRDAAYLVGVVAVVGHLFPVWLRFKGGKGIATGLGVVLAIQPLVALSGFVVYLLGCLILRRSGQGSLLGAACVAICGSIVDPHHWWQYWALFGLALYTLRHHWIGKVPNYEQPPTA